MFGYEDKEFENNLQVLMVAPDGSKWTVLDREDWAWAKEHKWHATSRGYAARNARPGEEKNSFLHREIALHMFGEEALKGKEVDHIDRNRLNNSRQNLRLATHKQNARNRSKTKTNTSGVTGVSWDKSSQKWRAKLGSKHLGFFATRKGAAEARKQAERELFGDFAPQ